jgi:ABC-2 type transport system ATP-binding protein
VLPLAVKDLTVMYGQSRGVLDVDLTADRGEVLGLLGPNGAGKTTLLRAALDLVHPTTGTVQIFGTSSRDQKARARVTYLPGDLTLPRRLTGRQVIARFTAGRSPVDTNEVSRLAEVFGVDLHRPIGSLSKGNRQKIGLVLAFAPRTPLLLLDEPTSGLDPLVQQTFAELLTEERERGSTVVLSSHVLSELEHLADRVAVIRDGRLAAVETMASLHERTRQHLTVRLASDQDVVTLVASLANLDGVATEVQGDHTVMVSVSGAIDSVVKALAGVTVVALQPGSTEIEGLLLDYYQDTP